MFLFFSTVLMNFSEAMNESKSSKEEESHSDDDNTCDKFIALMTKSALQVIYEHESDVLRGLIDVGFDLNLTTEHKWTGLMLASERGITLIQVSEPIYLVIFSVYILV